MKTAQNHWKPSNRRNCQSPVCLMLCPALFLMRIFVCLHFTCLFWSVTSAAQRQFYITLKSNQFQRITCGSFCYAVHARRLKVLAGLEEQTIVLLLFIHCFDCYVEYKFITYRSIHQGHESSGDDSVERRKCAFMRLSALLGDQVFCRQYSIIILNI